MTLTIHEPNIPIRFEEGGAVRVGPTRVTLYVLLSFYKQGMPAEQLVRSFPTLNLADVYSVLGYYLRHRAEMDDWFDQQTREADELQRQIESAPGYAERIARVKERMAAMRAGHGSAARR